MKHELWYLFCYKCVDLPLNGAPGLGFMSAVCSRSHSHLRFGTGTLMWDGPVSEESDIPNGTHACRFTAAVYNTIFMSSCALWAFLDDLFILHLQISLLFSPPLNSAWLRGNQLEWYYWRTSAQTQWERECFHVGWRKEWRTWAAVIHSHVESGRFLVEAQNKFRTEQRDSNMQITLISLLERSTSKSPRKDTCQATCLL